jgi:hypothetical protein
MDILVILQVLIIAGNGLFHGLLIGFVIFTFVPAPRGAVVQTRDEMFEMFVFVAVHRGVPYTGGWWHECS